MHTAWETQGGPTGPEAKWEQAKQLSAETLSDDA